MTDQPSHALTAENSRQSIVAIGLLLSMFMPVIAQSAQIRIDSVHYRPAIWEKEKVKEYGNQYFNEGGLVYVYFTNTSDKPISIKSFYINKKDASHWRLNHLLAWDRLYGQTVAPGESGVWELNGVSPDFAAGKPFKFAMVENSERAVARVDTPLTPDPARVSFIRVLPTMNKLEIHLRNAGNEALKIEGFELSGAAVASVSWTSDTLEGPGHAIANVTLAQPVAPATPMIVRVSVAQGIKKRLVCGHRRAFADVFPIGAWNSDEENLKVLDSLHIDTGVNGGKKTDKFFAELAPKYGHNAIVHVELPPDGDTVRELSGHPNVLCFSLGDEPDWVTLSNLLLLSAQTLRRYDMTKPTFLNLCRNVKFFEYAPIPDIAGHDHYCVACGSSSKWPKPYGTRLEETAYYTADLKAAAEPRPIWIWSQGVADWHKRPTRIGPTPDEIAAQLVLNLGRGAKGLLWFDYRKNEAPKAPDAVEAMRGWGRVLSVLRNDFLACEPSVIPIQAPEKVDTALLLGKDRAILCLTNTDYDLHPDAYVFREKKNLEITPDLPQWLNPVDSFAVAPEGIRPVKLAKEGSRTTVSLDSLKVCEIILFTTNADDRAVYEQGFNEALAHEK